jgi:hypothetical protein
MEQTRLKRPGAANLILKLPGKLGKEWEQTGRFLFPI